MRMLRTVLAAPMSLWPDSPARVRVQFLDGPTLQAAQTMNKVVRRALEAETHVYTRAAPRFLHGEGSHELA